MTKHPFISYSVSVAVNQWYLFESQFHHGLMLMFKLNFLCYQGFKLKPNPKYLHNNNGLILVSFTDIRVKLLVVQNVRRSYSFISPSLNFTFCMVMHSEHSVSNNQITAFRSYFITIWNFSVRPFNFILYMDFLIRYDNEL